LKNSSYTKELKNSSETFPTVKPDIRSRGNLDKYWERWNVG